MKGKARELALASPAPGMVLPVQLTAEAAEAVRELLAEGAAANTNRSYAAALPYWADWYRLRLGEDFALPLTEATLMEFVVDHFARTGNDGELTWELAPSGQDFGRVRIEGETRTLEAGQCCPWRRRSEIAAADMRGLRRIGPAACIYRLEHSKTQQADTTASSTPDQLILDRSADALREWIEASGIREMGLSGNIRRLWIDDLKQSVGSEARAKVAARWTPRVRANRYAKFSRRSQLPARHQGFSHQFALMQASLRHRPQRTNCR